jgi:hypothetical protein
MYYSLFIPFKLVTKHGSWKAQKKIPMHAFCSRLKRKKSNIQQPFGGKLFDDKEKEILGFLDDSVATSLGSDVSQSNLSDFSETESSETNTGKHQRRRE